MLYRAPGNIVDWMYKGGGIKYSYAVHLRDTGTVRLPDLFKNDYSIVMRNLTYSMGSRYHQDGLGLLGRRREGWLSIWRGLLRSVHDKRA